MRLAESNEKDCPKSSPPDYSTLVQFYDACNSHMKEAHGIDPRVVSDYVATLFGYYELRYRNLLWDFYVLYDREFY